MVSRKMIQFFVLKNKITDDHFKSNPKYYNPETLFRVSNFNRYVAEPRAEVKESIGEREMREMAEHAENGEMNWEDMSWIQEYQKNQNFFAQVSLLTLVGYTLRINMTGTTLVLL